MNIYAVGIETSYDYRVFPWLKKKRGSVNLKVNIRTVVAENPKEAECKYRRLQNNKMITWPAMLKLCMDGMWPVMCKEPNIKNQLWIKELDKKKPFDMYLQYMTPEDLCLLQHCV